jgi:hypothetical protein
MTLAEKSEGHRIQMPGKSSIGGFKLVPHSPTVFYHANYNIYTVDY